MGRVTKFSVGDYVHCIHRGAFGMKIFKDESDYWRFVRLLYLCNDDYVDHNFIRIESTLSMFERLDYWPPRVTAVEILSFVAMPNHFHILLREKREGGIAFFMKRLSTSLTMGFNKKYGNKGTIFQGKYKPVVLFDVEHFQTIIPYINVKNPMELYSDGGLQRALEEFDSAWEHIKASRFSSFKTFLDGTNSPILAMEEVHKLKWIVRGYNDKEMVAELLEQNPVFTGWCDIEDDFKKLSRECVVLNLAKNNQVNRE